MMMSSLLIQCRCGKCGNPFQYNPSHFATMGLSPKLPKSCPACIDEKWGTRFGKIMSRKETAFLPRVQLTQFPVAKAWQYQAPRNATDVAYHHAHWDGSTIGARWGGGGRVRSGSLTFYATHPFAEGDTVSIRQMTVQSLVPELFYNEHSQEWEGTGNELQKTVEYWYLDTPFHPAEMGETLQLRNSTYFHKQKPLLWHGIARKIDPPTLPGSTLWTREFKIGLVSDRAATTELWYIAPQGDIAIEQPEIVCSSPF